MRTRLEIASLIITFSLMISISSADASSAYDDPYYVNKVITVLESPVIFVGQKGILRMSLQNPFEVDMQNISLLVEPYMVIYKNDVLLIDQITNPPIIMNDTSNTLNIERLCIGTNITIDWIISTTPNTPCGDFFNPAVYLARLLISFEIDKNEVKYCSRGFFSDDEWNNISNPSNSSQEIDLEYLKSLGYDGIIPETSFTIKGGLPIWPIVLISIIAIISTALGIYYHIEERPGVAPRLFVISRIICKKMRKAIMGWNRHQKHRDNP